jgi:hypothetical protein
MNHRANVLGIFLVALLTSAPAAADPVFPPGSRIGIEPAPGLAVAKNFQGFEDAAGEAKVMVAQLPPAAFSALEAAAKARMGDAGKTEAAKTKQAKTKSGKSEKLGPPEPIATPAGRAYFSREPAESDDRGKRWALIADAGEFTAYVMAEIAPGAEKSFPEEAVRKMLLSVSIRASVPVREQLDLLPFRLSETAGFKNIKTVIPGSTVVLSDGADNAPVEDTTYMVITVAPGSPPPTEDRNRFAERLLTTIPGLRNMRVTSSEPIRIGGAPGIETRLEAVSGKADREVALIQWVRFGPGAYLRIVAGATKENWAEAFPRFRAVRDRIEPR